MSVLKAFLEMLESIFQKHAPEVVSAATTAATATAIASAQNDPKVQALVNVYTAVQAANTALKQAEQVPATPPPPAQ